MISMTIELFAKACAIGGATGLRATAGPAAVVAARPEELGGPLRWPVTRWAVALAVGIEFVGDKLPGVPSRLEPGALAIRTVAAFAAGAGVARAERGPWLETGAAAAACAVLAARIGHDTRVALARRLPDFVTALAEDAVALSLATRAST